MAWPTRARWRTAAPREDDLAKTASDDETRRPDQSGGAAFTEGSILRHIVATTSYGAIGLMTLFLVDLADLFFLSLLGQEELAAAVGYAGSILFFSTSLCIGLAIATAATISRTIGRGDRDGARRLVAHNASATILISLPLALASWFLIPDFLDLLGATGRTHELAVIYLQIILPSMPLLALAMAGGGVLRAVALPRLAMWSTVGGGLVNAALDPLLIFGLNLDIVGAAIASVAARVAVFGLAWYWVLRQADMLGPIMPRAWLADLRPFLYVALPAMATNLATPVGNTVVIGALSEHGDEAVAGFAIIGRLIPVAFATVFALSGAIGPIVGQNYGAGHFHRVRRALWNGLVFACVAVFVPSLLFYLLEEQIILVFGATGGAAELIRVFIEGITLLFIFVAALFVANAAFNNLGQPLWATLSNWGRATVGTIPLVWLGDDLFGAPGILWGQALGGVLFGALAFVAALWLVHKRRLKATPGLEERFFRMPLQATTVYRGWMPSAAALREEKERKTERAKERPSR
ncbi:MAG: MATE family efflux transporter [Rhodospirillales bacterium]